MPDINDLRQARAEQLEKVQALAALEADGTELSAEQLDEFVAAQTEFDSLTAKIERAEQAEKMAAKAAQPVPGIGAGSGGVSVPAEPKQPEIKGAKIARMVQAIGAVGRPGREAANYAETVLGDGEVAAALNTGEATAGGALVPQAFMGDLVELLQPASVVRSLNPIILPMPNGNITIPKMVGGATSTYLSEGDDITASEQSFGDLELRAKNLATLVPVSNDLLRYNGLNSNLEQVLVGDLTTSMGLREDLAFIRGDGSSNTPTGLRNLTPAANVLIAGSETTVQAIQNELGRMELALMNANVRMIRSGWIMSPTTYVFLHNLVDGNGNKVFPEVANGQLRGKPFRTTTQVPANLGAGGNETELYLADFADVVIGEGADVSIAVSTEASYKDPSTGDMISAFSRNQTLIRVMSAHDFGLRHDESTVVMTGITWTS
ncbi:MAG: phage major capsid protein [Thiolinea sp.]